MRRRKSWWEAWVAIGKDFEGLNQIDFGIGYLEILTLTFDLPFTLFLGCKQLQG